MLKINQETKKSVPAMQNSADLILLILLLLIRIPLLRMMGDEGIGYLSGCLELYFIYYFCFSRTVTKNLQGMMRFRIRREQYRNAYTLSAGVLRLQLMLLIPTVLIGLISYHFVAEYIFMTSYSWMGILFLIPALCFLIMIGPLKGFVTETGTSEAILLGSFLELILSITGLCGGAWFGAQYGENVAAIIFVPSVINSYAAAFSCLGLSLAQGIMLIYWFVLYLLYKKSFLKLFRNDAQKRTESSHDCIRGFLANQIPISVYLFLYAILLLIAQRIYLSSATDIEGNNNAIAVWGAFYGKYVVIIIVLVGLICQIVTPYIHRIVIAYNKDDTRLMRDRMEKLILFGMIYSLPWTIAVAVLAEPITKLLYSGMTSGIISCLQYTSVLIVSLVFVYAFHSLLIKMQYVMEGMIISVIGFVITMITQILFVKKMQMEFTGIGISLIIGFVIDAILAYCVLKGKLKYHINFMKCIIIPLFSAAIGGIISLLIVRFLMDKIGYLITLIVCLIVSQVIFMLILMYLRILNENQLKSMSFGKLWIAVGRNLGIFRS